jgi:hypothetical protein
VTVAVTVTGTLAVAVTVTGTLAVTVTVTGTLAVTVTVTGTLAVTVTVTGTLAVTVTGTLAVTRSRSRPPVHGATAAGVRPTGGRISGRQPMRASDSGDGSARRRAGPLPLPHGPACPPSLPALLARPPLPDDGWRTAQERESESERVCAPALQRPPPEGWDADHPLLGGPEGWDAPWRPEALEAGGRAG